jgi:hypothetical protein
MKVVKPAHWIAAFALAVSIKVAGDMAEDVQVIDAVETITGSVPDYSHIYPVAMGCDEEGNPQHRFVLTRYFDDLTQLSEYQGPKREVTARSLYQLSFKINALPYRPLPREDDIEKQWKLAENVVRTNDTCKMRRQLVGYTP